MEKSSSLPNGSHLPPAEAAKDDKADVTVQAGSFGRRST